jgi:hypothetical protein
MACGCCFIGAVSSEICDYAMMSRCDDTGEKLQVILTEELRN